MGARFQVDSTVMYIDPVQGLQDLGDADWVLISGSNPALQSADHLHQLLGACPQAQIILPAGVLQLIKPTTSELVRIHAAPDSWFACGETVQVLSVPGDQVEGLQSSVGYVLSMPEGRWYFSGYNQPNTKQLSALKAVGPLHTLVMRVGASNRLAAGENAGPTYTVHEAITLASELQVKQLAVQPNAPVCAEEVRLAHQTMGCLANLLINPQVFHLGQPKASVVVRTLNEARYLEELLMGIAQQNTVGLDCEVVLVDSGSTDHTLAIAEKYGCRILHITREQFSFGRSLNMGCEAATGDILVITSGHCVPASTDWLKNLCQPLLNGSAHYCYGKQLGGSTSQFSEHRVFDKYFPSISSVPQKGFYCNNANSSLLKSAWETYRFDEELTGLEDMELAQRLVRDGGLVAYVADAPVFHYHAETWPQVLRRFEREAIALQKIMPNIHVGLVDAVRYTLSSIWCDCLHAQHTGQLRKTLMSIVRYRYHQYTGSYRGNQQHRKLSHAEKDKYFYPN